MALPADIQDWDGAEDLFLVAKPISPRLELVWADSAYGRTDLPKWTEQACGWKLEIVRRPSNARGWLLLHRRWAVERTFAWICRNRRLSKDDEELAATTEAWVYAAMVRLMLRRLTPQAA